MRIKSLAVIFICLIVAAVVWLWTRTSPRPSDNTDSRQDHAATAQSSFNGNDSSVMPPSSVTSAQPVQALHPTQKIFRKAGSGSKAAPPIAVRPRLRRPPTTIVATNVTSKITTPKERYRGLQLSEPVQFDRTKKQILSARAIPKSSYDSSYGPIIFEHHGYSIVATDTATDKSWADLVYHANDKPVVVNASNGSLEVVTGTLMVKLEDIREADQFAGRHGLDLLAVEENVQVAYYRVPENFHMISGVNELKQVPGVLRIEMEVFRDPKGVW